MEFVSGCKSVSPLQSAGTVTAGSSVEVWAPPPPPGCLYRRMEVEKEDRCLCCWGRVREGLWEGTCVDTSAQSREQGGGIWGQVSRGWPSTDSRLQEGSGLQLRPTQLKEPGEPSCTAGTGSLCTEPRGMAGAVPGIPSEGVRHGFLLGESSPPPSRVTVGGSRYQPFLLELRGVPPLRTCSGRCSVNYKAAEFQPSPPHPQTQCDSFRESRESVAFLPARPGLARTTSRAVQGGGQYRA